MAKVLTELQEKLVAGVLAYRNTHYCSGAGETNAINNLRKKGLISGNTCFLSIETVTSELREAFYDQNLPAFAITNGRGGYLIFCDRTYFATAESKVAKDAIISALLSSRAPAERTVRSDLLR